VLSPPLTYQTGEPSSGILALKTKKVTGTDFQLAMTRRHGPRSLL